MEIYLSHGSFTTDKFWGWCWRSQLKKIFFPQCWNWSVKPGNQNQRLSILGGKVRDRRLEQTGLFSHFYTKKGGEFEFFTISQVKGRSPPSKEVSKVLEEASRRLQGSDSDVTPKNNLFKKKARLITNSFRLASRSSKVTSEKETVR